MSSVQLSVQQIENLVEGLAAIAERWPELAQDMRTQAVALGLGQSLPNVLDVATMVRVELVDPLAQALDQALGDGIRDADALATRLAAAIHSTVAQIDSALASLETLADGRQVLWLTLDLQAGTTLEGQVLNLSQDPDDPSSLYNQGLRIGEVQADVWVGMSGQWRVGVVLDDGLPADQAVLLDVPDWSLCLEAHASISDVQATYGVLDLGPATAQLSVDACLAMHTVQGAAGDLSLGQWRTMDWDTGVSVSTEDTGSAPWSLSLPFSLGIDGFDPFAGSLTLTIVAEDGFDGGFALVWPELSIGGVAFDFAQFTRVDVDDLGFFLTQLPSLLWDWVGQIDLPGLGLSLDELSGIDLDLDAFLDQFRDGAGDWNFTGLQSFCERLGAALGIPQADVAATLALRWSESADALQWQLPWAVNVSGHGDLSASELVGSDLGMVLSGNAQVDTAASLTLDLTVGLALTDEANVVQITGASLLTGLNSGVGLRAQGLVSGDDIQFTLRDGSTVGFDLDSIPGLGGSADIDDLLAVLNADPSDHFEASLSDNRLVLTDSSSGPGTFVVTAPQVTVTVGTSGSTMDMTSVSVAPLVLGLWGMSGADDGSGHAVITGNALGSLLPMDRIYLQASSASTPLLDASLTVNATLEGGAALGPLSLSVVDGEIVGSAGWRVDLLDTAVGDNDGRLYLSEWLATGAAGVFEQTLAVPVLDGILQFKVTPDALATTLNIDNSDYSSTPILTAGSDPNFTYNVPYLDLSANASDWSLSLEPSEKLKALLDGDIGQLDWESLPDLITALLNGLGSSDLWELPIPMLGISFGELLGINPSSLTLTWPDLGLQFDPTATHGGLDGWNLDVETTLEIAWPDLHLADPDLALRLQGLQWELGRIALAWEGRPSNDLDWTFDFTGRIGAWLGDFKLAMEGLSPYTGLTWGADLQSSLQRMVDFFDGLPLGIDGLEVVLSGMLPDLPHIDITIGLDGLDWGTLTLPSSDPTWQAPVLMFDLGIAIDAAAPLATEYSLESLDLGDVSIAGIDLLQFKDSGTIDLSVWGSLSTRFGVDLSNMSPLFDPADTTADFYLSISAPALELGVSLGGLAGVSVGDIDGGDPATIFLTDAEGSSNPAHIAFNGSDGLSHANAFFAAHLPVYASPVGQLAAIDLSGALTATSSSFSFDPTLTVEAMDVSLADLPKGLDGWIEGAIAFIDGLVLVLESDLVGQLPFVPDIDFDAPGTFLGDLRSLLVTASAWDTLGDVNTGLNDLFSDLDSAPEIGVSGSVTFLLDGTAVLGNDSLMGVSLDDLFSGTYGTLTVQLSADVQTTRDLDLGSLDLGLDGLNIGLSGTGGLDLLASVGLDIGLQYDFDRHAFEVVGAAGNDLSLDLGVGIDPDSQLKLSLGPLWMQLSDRTSGEVQEESSRELHASFGLDIGDGALSLDTAAQDLTVTAEVRALLDVDLTSNIGLGVSLKTGFYDVSDGPVSISWSPGDAVDFGDTLNSSLFHFDITSPYIDLEHLFGPTLLEMAGQLSDLFEPIDPVLDMLTAEIPLISDLSQEIGQGRVTYLDAISWFGEGAEGAAEFVAFMAHLSDMTATLATTGRIQLADLQAPAGSDLGTLSQSSLTPAPLSSEQAASNEGILSGLNNALNPLGITLPFLDAPGAQLANLLFGGNVELIYWDIPDLNASFDFRQSFPVFPPLYVALFGGVSFNTNFDLGFNTRGIRMALDSGSALDLVNGVYLVDTGHSAYDLDDSGNGSDAELTLRAEIGAGAELNVVVAKAGVDGGLRGTLIADLKDPDQDGKVYLDEFVDNLLNGPECIFDYQGALTVFLEAFIKVGVDTPFGFVTLYKDRFKLAEATLLDWSLQTCPPADPVLAEQSGGTLTLNTGARATRVMTGVEDGDEVFFIDVIRDGSGNPVTGSGAGLTVAAYNDVQAFVGVSSVVFDAGVGNDSIVFSPQVMAHITGRGGSGNDNLVGGSGHNTLYGDDGNDVLNGRAAADTLSGGNGDDVLYGYGGDDSVLGDAGDDALFGDDDNGDLAAFNSANAAFLAGSAGRDTVDGGEGDDALVGGEANDSLMGGNGDDVLLGSAGDDTLQGMAGNDQVLGAAGNDWLYGDDQAGAVGGGSNTVNADKLLGGEGFNFLDGGTGDDILYAVDDVQKADAVVSGTSPFARGWHSVLLGQDGQDMMYGTAGADSMRGGAGSDYLGAGAGQNWVYGGQGSDALIDGAEASTLLGGTGDDVVDAGAGNDWVEGGVGDDQIYAREGQDTVWGGTTGNDVVPGMVGTSHHDLQVADGLEDRMVGGFRATPSPDNCGPEIQFSPPVPAEVPPEEQGNPNTLQVSFFQDPDQDGQRDDQEALITGQTWQVTVLNADGDVVAQSDTQSASGTLQLSSDAYLPGHYTVLVVPTGSNPWGYTTETSLLKGFDIADATQTLPSLNFGFAQHASIRGQVLGDDQPKPGQTVFLDEDADLVLDTGERWVQSDSLGRYTFDDLVAGEKALVVLADVAQTVRYDATGQMAGWTQLTLAPGSNTANLGWFTPSAPVVSAVRLGQRDVTNQPVTLNLEDGPAQASPVLLGSTLIDRISLVVLGIDDKIIPQMTLQQWNGASWAHLPSYGTTLGAQTGGVLVNLGLKAALVDGDYRVVLGQDLGNRVLLDGEWVNAVQAGDLGDRFVSGDGVAGGDFVYNFRVGAGSVAPSGDRTSFSMGLMTAASSEDPSVRHLGLGTAGVRGQVWLHDSDGASAQREALEPGLSGQTVRLLDASGTELARVQTDASGQYSFDGLAAGSYRVSQAPDPLFTQAVRVARTPETLGVVAYSRSTDSVLEVAINGSSQTYTVPQQVYDVALQGGRIVYSGVDQNNQRGLWSVDLQGKNAQALTLGANMPLLVALDAPPNSDVLWGVDPGGQLWSFQVSGAKWTAVNSLSSGGVTLWPVGDLAFNADGSAWLVARYANDAGKQPHLVALDPATGRLLGPPMALEAKTQGQWIGLDWVGDRLVVMGDNGSMREVSLSTAGRAVVQDTELRRVAISGDQVHGGISWAAGEKSLGETFELAQGQQAQVGMGDTVRAGALDDHEVWHDGDDIIDGGCGNDADWLMGDDKGNLPGVSSGALVLEGGADVIRGRGGNDTLIGGQQGDRLSGDEGEDLLVGGSNGANRLQGGAGNDSLVGGMVGDQIFGEAGQDTLLGMDGDDGLYGGDGQDSLQGGNGDDVLVGGNDSDTVRGDAGSDTLVVTHQGMGSTYSTSILDGAAGLYEGGADRDTLVLAVPGETSDQTIVLNAGTVQVGTLSELHLGIEHALLIGGAGHDRIDASLFGGSSDQQGLAGQDTLLGGAGHDRLHGGSGHDTLNAGLGNDSLDGGIGSNTLDGAGGNDAYHLSDDPVASADLLVDASGADRLAANDLAGRVRVTQLSDGRLTIEQLDSGGASTQTLAMDGSAPSLVEHLLLGAGNDTIDSSDAPALAVTSIDAGDGQDWLDYRFSMVGVQVDLTAGTATGWLGATHIEHVVGSDLADRLRGDAGHNVFIAHGGNDTIDGVSGDDVLWLGAPDSSSTSGVTVRLSGASLATGTWSGGAFTVSDTLTVHQIDTLGGSGQADRFLMASATSPALFLDGGAKHSFSFGLPDTITGVVAKDFSPYEVNILDYSLYGTGAMVNLGAGTATGTAGIARIDRVTGGAFADLIVGNALSQALEGGAGNDVVFAGAGDDYLSGGSGSDLLVGGFGWDTAGYAGKPSDYTVSLSTDGLSHQVLHNSSGDLDVLIGIEQLAFYTHFADADWADPDTVVDPDALIASPRLHAVAGLKILGAVREGSVLSAAYTSLRGGLTPADLQWQWTADGEPLVGQTGTSLTLTQAMVGQTIGLQVSVEMAPGLAFDAGEASASGPVVNVNDDPTGRPWISGSPLLGGTLRARTDGIADEDGLGSFQYQWHVRTPSGLEDIPGAKQAQLTLGSDLRGKALAVSVRYTDGFGHEELLLSDLFGRVRHDAYDIRNPANGLPVPSAALVWQAVNGRPDLAQPVHVVQLVAKGLSFVGSDIAQLKLSLQGDFSQVASWTLTDANGRDLSTLLKGSASGMDLQVDYSGSQTLLDKDGVVLQLRLVMRAPAALDLPSLHPVSRSELVTDNGQHWVLDPMNLGVTEDSALPTGRVSIQHNGAMSEGAVLRAVSTLADANQMGALSYAWFADGQLVHVGQEDRLTLTQATVGRKISVEVAYRDGLGQLEVVSSSDSARVQNVNDLPTGSLAVNGTLREDEWLSVRDEIVDEDGLGTRSYRWMSGNQEVGTGERLALNQSLVGKALTVVATYTDPFGAAERVLSAATAPVQNVNDRPTGGVRIVGNARQGELLTASQDVQDADGMPHAPQILWYAGSALVGTGNTLRLTQAQVGKTVTAMARYTDAYGTVESVSSPATASVANLNDAPVLLKPVPDQVFAHSAQVKVVLSDKQFMDPDGDPLSIRVQYAPLDRAMAQFLSSGSPVPGNPFTDLPNWLKYSASAAAVVSTQLKATGFADFVLKVTASDGKLETSDIIAVRLGDTKARLSGKVIDGYVAGARIFVDSNGDGIAQPSEDTGLVTDAQGGFDGEVAAAGPIIAVGGTNVDTGLPNVLPLRAPQGATVVSPITTLVQSMVDQGSTALDAAARVGQVFGLTPSLNLLTFDPMDSATDDAQALAVHKLNVQLALAGTLAVSLSGDSDELADTLAEVVLQHSGGPLDLSQSTVIEQVLAPVVGGEQAQSVSTALSTALQAVASSTSQTQVAQTQQGIAQVYTDAIPDTTAPALLRSSPAAHARQVAVGASLQLVYDEAVQAGSGTIRLETQSGHLVESFASNSARLNWSGNTLTIDPTQDLLTGTRYRLVVANGAVQDAAGNHAEAYRDLVFTTAGVGTGTLGSDGDDSLQGTSGDDRLHVGLGNDRVLGGAGQDTAVLRMFPNAYTISGSGTLTAQYASYTTTLESIEELEFGSSFATRLPVADLMGGVAQDKLAKLTDLYLAFFGRAPDVSGLEYWMRSQMNEGKDFARISKDFSWSNEAQALFPANAGNRDFVRLVYVNCFGREPDQAGWDYWTGRLSALDPQHPEYLNNRGAFVGELVLGAYAPSSGPEDRGYLGNRHEVGMYYVNKLSVQAEEGFDARINDLLALVDGNPASKASAMNVIDHVFDDPVTLTGVMSDAVMLQSLWSGQA